jgi:hypothetical protein
MWIVSYSPTNRRGVGGDDAADVGVRADRIGGGELDIGIGPALGVVVDRDLLEGHLAIGEVEEVVRGGAEGAASCWRSASVAFHSSETTRLNSTSEFERRSTRRCSNSLVTVKAWGWLWLLQARLVRCVR